MLTQQQQRIIRERQITAFQKYCAIRDYDPKARADVILKQLKTRFNQFYGTWNLERDDYIGRALKKYRDAQEFFEIKNAADELRKSLVARLLESMDPSSMSDVYLAHLRRLFGLPNGSLEEILASIPVIPNWIPEFDASVSSTSIIEGLPSISFSETLLVGCETFLDCIVPAAIDFSGDTYDVRATKEAIRIGSTEDFVERLHSIIECTLGRTDFVIADQFEEQRALKLFNTMAVAIEGSILFVWLHEIGHLLQGHLMLPQSQGIELSADRFAIEVLASTDPLLRVLTVCGALTTLVLLNIIEKVRPVAASSSHPSARQRLDLAMQTLNIGHLEIADFASSYVPTVAIVCNPTLQRYWGVSLDFYTEL